MILGMNMAAFENEALASEDAFMKNIGSTVTKIICFTGACITAGIIFTNCGIDKATIQECKSSCSPQAMTHVSMFSCQCSYPSTSTEWVIPRTKAPGR